MKKLAIALTTAALISSISTTAAFADEHHDNGQHHDSGQHNDNGEHNDNGKHKGWYKDEVDFSDLDDFDWAKTAVTSLAKKGIIQGVDKHHFNPGGSLTRAEFSTLMSQYFALKPANPNQEDYVDVHKNDWFFSQVEATKDYMTKWTTSNGSYAFMPNKTMNRMDTAVSLVEILVHQGSLQLVSQAEADQILSQYADASSIPSSLRIHVATAIKAQVMKGVGSHKFNPLGTLNRAQAAQLLYNLQIQVEVPPAGTGSKEESTEIPPNAGSNNGSAQGTNPAANSILGVGITNTSTDANGNIHLNVHVTTTGVNTNTAVGVELVNQNGDSLNPAVVQSGTINNNDATVDLALPAGLSKGTYKLKVTVGSAVNQDTSYTKQ
ncbi:S-layer family protein [Aneurinibacillus soli]|uniref:Endo-1,4-beta-xylanase A n=1 Tax=Aneurinibacillus soli TaxID=1500254 RepID=A0A0U4WIV9_9BACL|nr:S-layer homology domain-containing protein [Aneurinibacillus soli]PYE61653.1 S-layer family protein [Aneurinibacillus soli]BAU28489.1 Endo-1,4-beta-xylanase A precursor [Aneurinibacillus soli]